MSYPSTKPIVRLEAIMSAQLARIAAANRYSMRVRLIRPGAVGLTISGTEYALTLVEMRALMGVVADGVEMLA